MQLIPQWLVLLCKLLGPGLTGVAIFLPPPYNGLAAIVGMVLSGLAGLGAGLPKLAEGKPLVSQTLAPTLAAAGGLLLNYALTLPEGVVKLGVLTAGSLCAWLAGKTLPPPVMPVKEPLTPEEVATKMQLAAVQVGAQLDGQARKE